MSEGIQYYLHALVRVIYHRGFQKSSQLKTKFSCTNEYITTTGSYLSVYPQMIDELYIVVYPDDGFVMDWL